MSSKRPIIVARMPVRKTAFRNTVSQQIQDAAVASSLARQASFAKARLVGTSRGVPLYATNNSGGGFSTSRGEVKFFDLTLTVPAGGLPVASGPPIGGEPSAAFAGITELNCVSQGNTSYKDIDHS